MVANEARLEVEILRFILDGGPPRKTGHCEPTGPFAGMDLKLRPSSTKPFNVVLLDVEPI